MDRHASAALSPESGERFLVRLGETGRSYEFRLRSGWRKFIVLFGMVLLGLFGSLAWVTWTLARGYPLAWYEQTRRGRMEARLASAQEEIDDDRERVRVLDVQSVRLAARFGVPWQDRGRAEGVAGRSLLDRLFPEETPSLALAREAQQLDEQLQGRLQLLQAGRDAAIKCAKLWERTPSVYPMRGQFSSPFGYRVNPVTGIYTLHAGIDLTNHIGTPIHAPAAGTVVENEYSPTYGNTVLLRHGNGVSTRFAHMVQSKVKLGQVLQRGDLIGLMGNTGRSTGPHLHYEVHVNNAPVNPVQWILPTVLSP